MADGPQLNPTVDFLAGTLAGIAGLVGGFPFDTVKVRLQMPELAERYRGSTARAIVTIVQEERVLGLYKGISSPLLTVALMNGLVFASYSSFLRLQLQGADTASSSLTQITLAGIGSGVVSAVVTTPTELIKIRQQQFTGVSTARGVAADIVKAGGLSGLYRGAVSTALRDCGYGAYFAAVRASHICCDTRVVHGYRLHLCRQYEATTRVLAVPGEERAGWPVLVAGGVAGVVGWLVTFPMDVVKTRVQGSGPGAFPSSASPLLGASPVFPGSSLANAPENPYRTTWSTIVHSYRREGLRVFYRGLAPTLIRAVPVNMVTFAVFEAVVNAFG
ncbi:carnitine/acyl carnitine carrier [Mycena maculata]|uniref:Carnitine/acyl carnitine carrier n=1 Tax=Mycena maculata TaxID=230809 RepID=A0AAD7IQI0_9AGAR|nr:carnitine/acyl carnitine carrier [Mycena maculata]